MIQGTIVKGIGGFYYVSSEAGMFECRARGKLRNENITPMIGDEVLLEPIDSSISLGSLEKILPRKNALTRPAVSNVDQAIIVFSAASPTPNIDLLDRFLVLVAEQSLSVVLCINKIDLDLQEQYKTIQQIYTKAGYPVVLTSTKKQIGIAELKSHLAHKISVFAGPSGVGKSTLLNSVQPSLQLITGAVSEKIKRGKHTTRHVELLPLDLGGYIVDTPGFTSLTLDHINHEELQQYFREFQSSIGTCKFTGCSHTHEPSCTIKQKVLSQEIDACRYNRYKNLYEEMVIQRRRLYD